MSKNVFIGSSAEARKIVDRIANRLRSKHYNPIPSSELYSRSVM